MKTQHKETLTKLLKLITDHLDNDKIVEGNIDFTLTDENDPWGYEVDCDITLINFPHVKDLNELDGTSKFKIIQTKDSLRFYC